MPSIVAQFSEPPNVFAVIVDIWLFVLDERAVRQIVNTVEIKTDTKMSRIYNKISDRHN